MKNLPEKFVERLQRIIPSGSINDVLSTFENLRPLSLRVNTLKALEGQVIDVLNEHRVSFKKIDGIPSAFVLEGIAKQALNELSIVKDGAVYQQSLSSLLVSVLLSPQSGERVLDLCAAPGSKTSHLAMLMNNQGELIAVDSVKDRFFKLRSVLALLGVKNAIVKLMDGRRFWSDQLFDKILVDAPCSSEGRFHLSEPKSFAYWSERKIKEMVHKQRGILLNASRYLKRDGVLIYSTCTFSPEENEGVIHWFLKKTKGSFVCEPISKVANYQTYPAIAEWNERSFNPQVENTIRILPDQNYDGFFIAQLKRTF